MRNKRTIIITLIAILVLTGLVVSILKITKWQGGRNRQAHSRPALPAVTLAVSGLGRPKDLMPISINIPEGAGHIVEGYKAPADDAKIIIHLQDIHTNYEAQKNASRIIEALVKNNDLKLVMVEGGWGDVSLSYLRSYADTERRLEVAEEYLKSGKISGEEYLDIVSDYDLSLEGLEEEALYKANLDTFFAIEQFREQANKEISGISAIVRALQKKIYSPQLLELEKAKQEYEEEKISLADYYKYVDALAKKTKQSLSSYPNFKRFIEVAGLEKDIKFPVVEQERSALIEKLSKKLTKQQLTNLVTKSLEFRLNKLTPSEYHEYLFGEAKAAQEPMSGYPNLEKYLAYVRAHEEIDTAKLFEETEVLSAEIEAALIKNDQQRKLYEISRSLHVLDNFLNLKLVPNDFKYYKQHRNDFNTAAWMSFLQKEAKRYKVRTASLKPAYILDKNLSTLVKFYDLANKRDDAFVQNAIKLMNEENAKVAVLIAGGFHTPSLKQKLKECGMSYVVVAPHTTQQTDPEQYRYILRYKSGKEE